MFLFTGNNLQNLAQMHREDANMKGYVAKVPLYAAQMALYGWDLPFACENMQTKIRFSYFLFGYPTDFVYLRLE